MYYEATRSLWVREASGREFKERGSLLLMIEILHHPIKTIIPTGLLYEVRQDSYHSKLV